MSKILKYKIGQRIKDEKRDITIIGISEIKRKSSDRKDKYYKFKCNICGFDGGKHYSTRDKQYKDEYWISKDNLEGKQQGCACCANQIVVQNINSIYKTNTWMIPYIGEEVAKTHTHSSEYSVYPTCPDCGRIKNKKMKISTIYQTYSIGCICGKGNRYPNKFALNMLEQLNIQFKTEYNPKWIKPKRFDFYFELNNKKYILEMDGGFHNKDNLISGQTKEESKAIDDYKDEQAKLHGIEVIRIDCDYNNDRFEYIKNNILTNIKLNSLFDLNKIDWNKVEEFALSNLVKVASQYKRNNPNLTCNDIAKIMNIHDKTVRRWLVQGTEIGWCYYNAEKEVKKKNIIVFTKLRKMVEVFKDNISQGVFESTIEIERKSLELFGFLIRRARISEICLGKRKSYKGYTFKYISKLTSDEYIKLEIENKLKELELSNKDNSFFIK